MGGLPKRTVHHSRPITTMTRQPIGRNAKCPCGSGKKYKQCCLGKGYTYEEEASGTVRRSVPMSDELGDMLQQHVGALSDELGKEPEPDDALFPNQHLEHAEHQMVQGMKAAGVDPALIYAFEQTGILVGEDNQHLFSDKDLAKWQDAIDRYRAQHAESEQGPAAGSDEEEMSAEDTKMAMELMQAMDPEALSEMMQLAQQCNNAEEFANMILIGPCPHCDSENTTRCKEDPELEDAGIGRCKDCGRIWCCFCKQFFNSAEEATRHDCLQLEDPEDDLDEPF